MSELLRGMRQPLSTAPVLRGGGCWRETARPSFASPVSAWDKIRDHLRCGNDSLRNMAISGLPLLRLLRIGENS